MSVLAPERLSHRADFPGVADWHYLDTAATAQKPQVVIDAIARAYGPDYATVHRGVYARSANMTLAYEAARRTVARFIGAQSDSEIVFVRGATVGELDKAALFYMASRGMDPVTAQTLLLRSFIAGVFDSVADEAVRETLEAAALAKLEALS